MFLLAETIENLSIHLSASKRMRFRIRASRKHPNISPHCLLQNPHSHRTAPSHDPGSVQAVLTLVCLCLCLSPVGSQRISDSEFSDYDGEDGVGVVSGKMLAGTVKMTPSDGGDEDIYC